MTATTTVNSCPKCCLLGPFGVRYRQAYSPETGQLMAEWLEHICPRCGWVTTSPCKDAVAPDTPQNAVNADGTNQAKNKVASHEK